MNIDDQDLSEAYRRSNLRRHGIGLAKVLTDPMLYWALAHSASEIKKQRDRAEQRDDSGANMPNKPSHINLLDQAQKEVIDCKARCMSNLVAEAEQIKRFENFCAVLAEHDMDFKPRVTASDENVYYMISMGLSQSAKAGDMLLTLDALGCELKAQSTNDNSSFITKAYEISGEHAPTFTLLIHSIKEIEASHAEQLAA